MRFRVSVWRLSNTWMKHREQQIVNDKPVKAHAEAQAIRLFDASFCIVAARFNGELVEKLVDGAV